MADDLLRRARRLDTCIFPNERSRCLCGELADRIEQLEAALREIAYDWKDEDDPETSLSLCIKSAVAALGEKKDV
jgi:hypothetical protein